MKNSNSNPTTYRAMIFQMAYNQYLADDYTFEEMEEMLNSGITEVLQDGYFPVDLDGIYIIEYDTKAELDAYLKGYVDTCSNEGAYLVPKE